MNCLVFIYKMMQASKANESVSEYSKTGLCITVKVLRGNTQKSFKCDRGPIFPSEIHYLPDPTARNGSLDM